MLYDAVDDPASRSTDELREAYETQIRRAIERVGVETAAERTGVDRAAVETVAGGPAPDLRLEDAAELAALDGDAPDAETIVLEIRDHLLLGMTTGVLDVDTIASNVDLDLSGQEIQQAIEGRSGMTLRELAAIQRFIEERNDR